MLTQIFGGVSAIAGLLGAQSAARRQQQERMNLLNNMQSQIESGYLNDIGQNSRQLYSEAGAGGDAIRALGGNMGAGLAAGGVYNSSSVAGATALGQRDQSSAIAQLAARLQQGASQRRQQGLQHVNDLRFGVADSGYNQAQSDLSGARGGLSSFLGSMVQNNLMKSGANMGRASIPPIVNGTINQGANLPGNAGMGSGIDWRKMLDLRSTPPIVGNYGGALGGRRY